MASNTTGVQWCRKGKQATWDNPNKVWKCCDKECDQCGGQGCKQGDDLKCCHQHITEMCEDDKSTGCIIPYDGPRWSQRWCKKGEGLSYDTAHSDVPVWKCCDKGCDQCGGSGCEQDGKTCCHQHISNECTSVTDTACEVREATGGSVCRLDANDGTSHGGGTTCRQCPFVNSMEECKKLCENKPGCTGLEYGFQGNKKGRCEIWTHSIGHKKANSNYVCIRRDEW